MAIYKSDIVDINLESGSIHRSFLKHAIGTADQAADRFGIRAFRDGQPVDLSGASCYGYFRNSHGTNIALTSNGTVSGNVAYVTLPQACYNYEGNFTLAVKLLVSGVTSTVRIIDGVVDNTNTGSAVAPTSAVPTYSEILSQYDAMVAATAVANGAIATTFNAATVYPAGSYVINDGALYRITADHAANVTWANTSKVATNFGAEVTALKSAIDDIGVKSERVASYLFQKDSYINTSGVITTLSGYDLFYIPLDPGDFLYISQGDSLSGKFWKDLNVNYVFKWVKSDGTYESITPRTSGAPNDYFYEAGKIAAFIGKSGYKGITISTYADYTQYVNIVFANKEYATANDEIIWKRNTTTELISASSPVMFYLNSSGNIVRRQSTDTYRAIWMYVYSGDKITFSALATGATNYGVFRAIDGTISLIETSIFTASSDGLCSIATLTSGDTRSIWHYPKAQINIPYSAVLGTPVLNQFEGLTGVAFGTSLTARATEDHKYDYTTYGYLTYLRQLSGITFDNQGLGNSTIVYNQGRTSMMPVITGYTDYADKDVAILEGFVNDFDAGSPLGTWQDADTLLTVCGRVRRAINYIFSQNANIKLFLILDHYGRDYNSVNTSSTAKNANNITQFEFYSEVEKVAESLGVIVIREFATSEICENTPQYLVDNIHCNDLGAQQSAKTIWSVMKQYYPNAVSD